MKNYPFYQHKNKLTTASALEDFTYQTPEINPSEQATEYEADESLIAAVNTALLLGKPLLLTGDTGTGKTSLAASVAYQLKLTTPLIFNCKSTSQAQDLFYHYDALRHYRAEKIAGHKDDVLKFIQFNALGIAIINSHNQHHLQAHLSLEYQSKSAQRHVVLIDEIDKTPRDFPNDLLHEIDHYCFQLREWGNQQISVQAQYKPVVIITSNSEKNLPDAFMRRCIYHHIEFPQTDLLLNIALGHLSRLYQKDDLLLHQAIKLFLYLRQQNLNKKPATAELIDWLKILANDEIFAGFDKSQRIQQDNPSLRDSLNCLLKNHQDRQLILGDNDETGLLDEWFNQESKK